MWFTTAAFALELSTVSWKGQPYTVVHLEPTDRIELVGQADPQQRTLHGALQGNPWAAVAMNAGMYHPGYVPVGLHVEAGIPFAALETRELDGNFGLLPNGVFALGPQGPFVVTTPSYKGASQVATQSGPMLVIAGELHPAFNADSTSKKVRNGVGVTAAGDVWWVISEEPVRFHDLATLFRDRLRCPDALFLDGTVSELRSRDPERHVGTARTFGGVLLAGPRAP